MNPELEAELAYLEANFSTPFKLPTEAVAEERPGLGIRFAKQMGNVPGMALEGLMGVGTGIANLFEEAGTETAHAKIPQLFSVPQAETPGEVATDIVPQLLGVLPQFLVPGGIAAKAASRAGMGIKGATMLGQTVGGLFGGLAESPTGAVAEGTVGAAQGWAERLPRGLRLGAAGIAGVIGAGQALVADQTTTGSKGTDALLFGLLNFGTTFASPQIGHLLKGSVASNAAGKASEITITPHQPTGMGAVPVGGVTTPSGPGMPVGGPTGGALVPIEGQPYPMGLVTSPVQHLFPNPVQQQRVAGLIGQDALQLEGGAPRLGYPESLPYPEGPLALGYTPPQSRGPFELGPSRTARRVDALPFTDDAIAPEPEPSAVASLQTEAPLPQAKTAVSRVRAPAGMDAPHAPLMEGAHVISSAVKQGKKLLVGSKRNSPHEMVGIEHDLISGEAGQSIDEGSRGFIVQNADGTIGFANRKRAAKIAFKAGQMLEDNGNLKSEDAWHSEAVFKTPDKAASSDLKQGDVDTHWNDDGDPLDIEVLEVKDGHVTYNEFDLSNGRQQKKVATLQEWEQAKLYPAERRAAKIKPEAAAPPAEELASGFKKPIEPAADAARKAKHEKRLEAEEQRDIALARVEADKKKIGVGQFQVLDKGGWAPAKVLGREGNTLHIEIDDPIFGKREAYVLESETRTTKPKKVVPDGGVPFRESIWEGAGPSPHQKNSLGKDRDVYTVADGLQKLPPEARTILGSIIQKMVAATGQKIDLGLATRMQGKGGAYVESGRININLNWMKNLTAHWDKMSPKSQTSALLRITSTIGHEITHIAQIFGERSGLKINGKPLLEEIKAQVAGLSQGQREYIAAQIQKTKLEPSSTLNKYLAGDIDAVWKSYKQKNPNLSRANAETLAAGEFMAELGSVELIGRMQVQGLPQTFRDAIDQFKGVVKKVVDWFRGQNDTSGVAALQKLKDIAAKMHDHLSAADDATLRKAYPTSGIYDGSPLHPVSLVPSGAPGHVPRPAAHIPSAPTAPVPNITTGDIEVGSLVSKSQFYKLATRAGIGAVVGGVVGPSADSQTSTAEGMLYGGVLGLFGPAVVRNLLKRDLASDIAKAAKASGGNPVKAFTEFMGSGKNLRELGAEGRYGWNSLASSSAKFVRMLEKELKVNFDPFIQAIVENGKGIANEQLALVMDAMNKIRWFKVSAELREVTGRYFKGEMSKQDFLALLPSDSQKLYGSFAVTAREGTTTLIMMLASGMKKSKLRDHIMKTSENYLTRSYAAYEEGKFDMTHFDKVRKDLMQRYPGVYTPEMADAYLHAHMAEVQANRGMFGGSGGGLTGQKIEQSTGFRRFATEGEIETQQVVVGALEHNPHSPQYQAELEKLMWMQEHKINDSWREWLGEYKDPIDNMIRTFQHVYPSAIAGQIFDLLDQGVDTAGNRFAYTGANLKQAKELLAHELSKLTPADEDFASLQLRVKELDAYDLLPSGAKYGKLADKWVSRFVRDELNTYDTPYKWMDQPILRSIAQFNNMVKMSRAPLNLITVIRNYMQLPVFMLMANVKPGHIGEAFNTIHRGLDPELLSVMRRKNILDADYIAAELGRGANHLSSGFLDSDIAVKVGKYGLEKVLDFYRQPDMLLRAGAFIGARKRFADKAMKEGKFATLQEALTDNAIIDRAAAFTERFTMNYGTVPRIVKAGRQLPFVNIFISYFSEITKVLKNTVSEVIKPTEDGLGRPYAMSVLAGLAAIPALIVAGGEGSLSEKDRKDWEKVKQLSPDYNRSRFLVPYKRDETGRFHFFDITNLIPTDSYSQMVKSLMHGDMEAVASANPIVSLQNTPVLNIVSEQITGVDLRTGAKFNGKLDRVREVLKEIVPPLLPPGYEATRIARGFSENREGGMGLTNLRTGVQVKPSDIIANYMTGMRFGNVQLTTLQKQAKREAQEQIAVQNRLMRETTGQNVPLARAVQAHEIRRHAVTEILLQLHTRLNLEGSNPDTTRR